MDILGQIDQMKAQLILLEKQLKCENKQSNKPSTFNPYEELISFLPKGLFEVIYSVVDRQYDFDKSSFLEIGNEDDLIDFLRENMFELLSYDVFDNHLDFLFENVVPESLSDLYYNFDNEMLRMFLENMVLKEKVIEFYFNDNQEHHELQCACSEFYEESNEILKHLDLSYCINNELLYVSDIDNVCDNKHELLEDFIDQLEADSDENDNMALKELINDSGIYSLRSTRLIKGDFEKLIQYATEYECNITEFVNEYRSKLLDLYTKEELFDVLF